LVSHQSADSQSALARAAIGGDRDAVGRLWRENRRWIAAVILTHKPAYAELEDLLQEVAMTLVTKVHTLRDEANVRAWLRIIAINVARAAARSGKHRQKMSLEQLNGHEPAAAAAVGDVPDDGQSRIVRAVAQLPEEYREPLLMRAINGMRSTQIGDILGITPATVDTRVARARAMLRERLGMNNMDAASHSNTHQTPFFTQVNCS
jgi:RNA polymerase sigma-70 factor (ECF subfamily)